MPPQLHVMSGPDRGREFTLPAGQTAQVGRSQTTLTQLTDPSISRLHFEIDLTTEPPILHNRSGNGTLVNGRSVTSHPLRHGDLIRIGTTDLCFLLVPAQEASTLRPLSMPRTPNPRRGPQARALSDEETTVPWAEVLGDRHGDRPATQPLLSLQPFDFLAPSIMPDELGRLGHYRVLELLGEGGMGYVFRGEDSLLQRPVALKVMKQTGTQDNESRERFTREARSTANLKNDHIVTIYSVGKENDVPYLAMELLEGESLHTRLQRGAALSLGDVLQIGREAALGLSAAHDKGVIHRDIKPENLWLETLTPPPIDETPAEHLLLPTFRVKLLDFGLARATDSRVNLTRNGWLVGTPDWMSPEQARGEQVDHRCDLFSLGCVLYFLCTGRMPFAGADIFALLAALMQTEPPPVIQLNPVVPQELSDLIAQLLGKLAAQRPANAHLVARRIAAIEQQLLDPP